jgi:hypothetical protein
VHKNKTRAPPEGHALAGVRRRCESQPRMKQRPAVLEELAAARQVEHVVAVASIRLAATAGDHPTGAESTEVVGDQVLRQPQPGTQLADPQLAVRQRGQQPPAEWMRR